jgi:hypothetical protein
MMDGSDMLCRGSLMWPGKQRGKQFIEPGGKLIKAFDRAMVNFRDSRSTDFSLFLLESLHISRW